MTKQELIRTLGEQAKDLVDGYSHQNLRADVTLHLTCASIDVHTPYRSFVYQFRNVKYDPFDGTILRYERPFRD